jgi:hypothetical protein
MNKIRCLFFGVLLCSTSLFAQIEYEYEHKFVLKKDEVGLVLINHKEVTKKPTADNPNNEYLLKLRWTLFTNNMLTLLVNYRGYPTQYVLEQILIIRVICCWIFVTSLWLIKTSPTSSFLRTNLCSYSYSICANNEVEHNNTPKNKHRILFILS